VPPETTYWSPYSGLDALCGNTLMIPVDELVGMGLLDAADRPAPQPEELNADFTAIAEWKVGGWSGGYYVRLKGDSLGGWHSGAGHSGAGWIAGCGWMPTGLSGAACFLRLRLH
jgi:hypothetical protein